MDVVSGIVDHLDLDGRLITTDTFHINKHHGFWSYYRWITDNKMFNQHAMDVVPSEYINPKERMVLIRCSIKDWHEIYD